MDPLRLNSQLRYLVDCASYTEISQELDKLLKLKGITETECGEDWEGAHEFFKGDIEITDHRTECFNEVTSSVLSLSSTKSKKFWTEITIFTYDLIYTLMKKHEKIGRSDISEANIRMLPFGYWPPELFRGEEVCEKSLVYTFGAFLIHLISDRLPFNNFDYPQLLYNVGSGKLLLDPPADCYPLIASLIVECCRFNPEKRPTFQALYHRHFTATN